jgi:hypothetical protein
MNSEHIECFEMHAPVGWLQAVDHWRAKQDVIPSREEAIRRLVEHALQLATSSRAANERMDVWDADVARLHGGEKG